MNSNSFYIVCVCEQWTNLLQLYSTEQMDENHEYVRCILVLPDGLIHRYQIHNIYHFFV